MKIECVVVCANYSDFFSWCLPCNKQLFDRMVVVTTPDDKVTQKLCEYWHVQCVVTDVCYEDNADFNKGKMINAGLAKLSGDGWIIHMDADIFLPPLFRQIVSSLELDQSTIYSIDRLMCDSFKDWLSHWMYPKQTNEAGTYVHFQPFKPGTRIVKPHKPYDGWVPIGFFQMWHQGSNKLTYPTNHNDAGRTDMLFSMKFARKNRQLLPEILAIHLATKMEDGGKMGINWGGRKTPIFGEEIVGADFLDQVIKKKVH